MIINTINKIDNYIKKEDDTSVFKIQLADDKGNPYPIPNDATLDLIAEINSDIFHFNLNVVNQNEGILSFDVGDLKAGIYNCEIILSYVEWEEEIRTFPTNGYFSLQIYRNLSKQ